MISKISLTDKTLPSCFCGSYEKLDASLVFGHLTIKCRSCDRNMMSEVRSGCAQYILDKEMTKRWETPDDKSVQKSQ